MFKKLKKALIILAIILFIASVAFILFLLHVRAKVDRGELLYYGGQWMTREEYRSIVPPQYKEIEAKNKPEEVYAEFRQALLDNDIEKALSLMTDGVREEYRKAFENKDLLAKYKVLPSLDKIQNVENDGNYASLSYFLENKNTSNYIQLKLNVDGYWLIDFI